MNEININEFQIDALREIGNIGAGHAATSLSRMTKMVIDISVPEISVLPLSEFPSFINEEEIVAGSLLDLYSASKIGHQSIFGYICILFPKKSAITLANILTEEENEFFSEMGQSALMEVSNIMTSTFLNATTEFLDITTVILHSPPSFSFDMCGAMIDGAMAKVCEITDNVIIFKTKLSNSFKKIDVFLLLFMKPETLPIIFSIIDEKIK
jgi:chemotaxis protein CheC